MQGELSLGGEMKHGVHTKRKKIRLCKASQQWLKAGENWRCERNARGSRCREWMDKVSAELCADESGKSQNRWKRLSESGFFRVQGDQGGCVFLSFAVWGGAMTHPKSLHRWYST